MEIRARSFLNFLWLLIGLSLAGPALAGEFRIVDIGERSFDDGSALAIVLSEPLDPTRIHDLHLRVETDDGQAVRGAWILADNRRVLYFPAIEPDTAYRVQVAGALAAADGRILGEPVERTVRTRPVTPGVGFADQGLVLPRTLARGLPVRSINVAAVDIDFLRVAPDRAAEFLREFSPAATTSSYSLDNMRPYAQLVYSARYGLTGATNKRATTLIPVLDMPELSVPGLYVAAMKPVGRYPYEYQTAYFFVSDIGLLARVYGDSVMVFANALSDAQPLAGIEVSVYERKGERLDAAVTDADGKVRLRWGDEAHLILARRGDDLALLPLGGSALDLSEFAIDGRPASERALFVYAPRDLYRPGEAVPVSALLRDHDGRPVPAQPLAVKLLRPDGQLFGEQVWQPGPLGYYQYTLRLPERAQTGTWMLELRTDPASAQPLEAFRIQVEEFLPERMRLTLDSPAGPLAFDQPLTVDYAGDYLYGAPAAGQRVDTVLVLERNVHPVVALPAFHFGDVDDGLKRERRELGSLTLDAQGRAVLTVDPLEQRPASPIGATVVASLFEHGGRPVTRVLRRDLWPAPALVGVRPSFAGERAPPEGEVEFEIVKAQPDGTLLAAEGLDVALIKEDRDYFWMYDADRGWRSEYSETAYPVLATVVATTAGGAARVSARVEHGHYRLEVRDPETGLITRLRFIAGWSWEDPAERAGATRPDRVALSLDREASRVGDTVRLTLEPPHAGEALILVEGDRLLAYQRLPVPAGPTTVAIPVEPGWDSHDIYITAVVLRPASREQRITPNRAMGVIHLPLDRRDRRLVVSIEAPAEMRPERTLTTTVTVPEAGAEPVYVTLAAVDVGVLSITDFATPDPWAWFFAKRRLGVDARDLYGQVIEAFEGERARLRFGGDTEITPGGKRPPAMVRIVSLFTGPVALDARGQAQIPLEIPDFNGQLRLMAVVFGADRFGAADAEVTVAAPVVAEVAMPRFLAPGDRSQITLDLHNRSGGPLTLDLALTADGPLMLGPGTWQLALDTDAREVLRLPLGAADTFGVGTLRLAVDGADLAIRRSWELGVRPPWPAEHRRERRRLLPGESLSLQADALAGLIRASVEGGLLVSARPVLDLERALADLLGYPYGCLEQTTSRAYPLLYADAQAARLMGIEPLAEPQRLAWIEEAIERVRALQLPNGAFALWNEQGPEDAWLSAYVTDFLLDARDQGFSVPETVLQRALEQLQRVLRVGGVPISRYAQNAAHLSFAAQAYAGYLLARVNQAPLGQLRELYDKHRQDAAAGLPLAHLGLALGLQGDQRRSQAALAEAVAKPRADAYLGDYGSPIRDTAMIVHLLLRHGVEAALTEELLFRLDDALAGQRWPSTQERVATFLAGLSLTRAGTGEWQASLAIGPTARPLASADPWRWPVDPNALAAGLTLTNTSDRPLYTAFEVSGYPASRPEPVTKPMTIARSWYTLDGTPMDLADLAPGQMALVRLQLQSEVPVEHGLVVDLLLAGLEIENANLSRGEAATALSIGATPVSEIAAEVEHVEFREDRFVAALALDPGRTYDLFYLVRAVTPGEYVVPPPFAEDMYRPHIRAVGEGVGRLGLAP